MAGREAVLAELVRRGAVKPTELAQYGVNPADVPDMNVGPVEAPPPAAQMRDHQKNFINPLRGDVPVARDLARMGDEFLTINAERATGGLMDQPWTSAFSAPKRQAMEGISAKMLRSTIKPGTSGTVNSNAEQEIAMRSFPNVATSGPTNVRRVTDLKEDAWLKNVKAAAAEKWLSSRNTPDGFELAWSNALPTWRAKYAETRQQVQPGFAGPTRTTAAPRREAANATLKAKTGAARGMQGQSANGAWKVEKVGP